MEVPPSFTISSHVHLHGLHGCPWSAICNRRAGPAVDTNESSEVLEVEVLSGITILSVLQKQVGSSNDFLDVTVQWTISSLYV